MATASAGRATRVRRRLPRVARALVARRSRGLRAGQGRGEAHGQTAQLLRLKCKGRSQSAVKNRRVGSIIPSSGRCCASAAGGIDCGDPKIK